jgi:hypothetical protein
MIKDIKIKKEGKLEIFVILNHGKETKSAELKKYMIFYEKLRKEVKPNLK